LPLPSDWLEIFFPRKPNNGEGMVSTKPRQGSCAGLEFKASLEKSLNFRKLKKALNCFGKKTVEGLEKFGSLSIVKVSTRFGDCVNGRSCCKAGRRTA